jgi:hypothetical protein
MPLVGKSAVSAWASTTGNDFHSASWEINFPPRATFAKVFLGSYFEFRERTSIAVGLINIRRLLPSGAAETISFPPIDSFEGAVLQRFDQRMTSVTFGIKVKAAIAGFQSRDRNSRYAVGGN